ncbi:MAG: penicillin-binding protein [Prochlorococcus sp. SP3034]|nr:penicillin-binding protein [Prochlorococcus sp. SP3034]
MLKLKQRKYLLTPLFLFFIILLFPLINIIKITTKFKPENLIHKDNLNYSYEIYSSDNKLINKLSRKYDVLNDSEIIPTLIKNAFISGEDKRFMYHNGIDLMGLLRAFKNNLESGYIREGGSTITQQVSRIIFLNNDLNIKRKIKELIISLILDFKYSKSYILKLYLNNIYLGSGAYGVNEASQIYFGKFINELSLSEIALIVGLAPAPSIYSPFNNINLALKNRDKILYGMYSDGYITKNDLNYALNEKIKLNNPQENSIYLGDSVLINFILNETNKLINYKGIEGKYNYIKIKSSINTAWQNKAQNLARSIQPEDLEIALVTIDSNSGLIRTMISGKEPISNTFNRATYAIRPLSSTFKIIPYMAAFKDGKNLKDKYYDVPTCWDDYCPKNFSNIYKGKISLIEAFKSSSNIVPIKISKELGLEKIITLANEFGIGYQHKIEEFLPLAIGSYGDSLLNISNVYSTINNSGWLIKPSILEKLESRNGEIIWENNFEAKRVIKKINIKKLNKILEKSVSEGSGIAASIRNEKIFGKTGTSDGNRDLWFIGSLKGITTGVWLGFDDYKKTNLSSANAALFWKMYIKSINQSE